MHLGSRGTIDQVLFRLVKQGMIRRLDRGVYDYPKHHATLGTLSPNPDGLARALAGGDRVFPSGAVAANTLGLSTQVPAKSFYVTNSTVRSRCIAGQTIKLKRARVALLDNVHDKTNVHDLKSPLRAIAQHLSLIKSEIEDKLREKSRRSLEFAVEGAKHMHALIDTLYTYAQVGFTESEFGLVDMQTVLQNVQRDLSVSIEETGASITSDPLPLVTGDALLLSQLLQNLVGNAIKYCKGAPRIHIGALLEGAEWRMSVSDNGIGIAPEQYEKIFIIFRRLHLKNEYSGIGLGLAVCYRIIKRHGGKIWVESNPGKGSIFHFTLPVAEAIPQRKASYG